MSASVHAVPGDGGPLAALREWNRSARTGRRHRPATAAVEGRHDLRNAQAEAGEMSEQVQ
jgi:hypothetical protein